MKSFTCFFLSGLLFLLAAACRPTDNSEKIAEVDGVPITIAEVDRSAGKAIYDAREQLYKLQRQKLDDYISATLLTREAKRRNISVSKLLEQEVNDKISPVTEEEIQRFYDANKDRLRVELGKVHDQIREYLRNQKLDDRKKEFFKSLRAKAKIKTYLQAPPVYRARVAVGDAPIRGAAQAPVTIVKFEDFQCPFCKSVQPTFKEILKQYDGKVRVIHKDLPLEAIHPFALQSAEAARCAGEQGKFWQYHDQLYAVAPKLSVDELKASAKEVGLNTTEFDQCLASGKYRAAVQKDVNEGAELGITGTPTFFINGREMSGAQPLEAFAVVIDEELGQKR